jgi:hypothetical protein
MQAPAGLTCERRGDSYVGIHTASFAKPSLARGKSQTLHRVAKRSTGYRGHFACVSLGCAVGACVMLLDVKVV